MELTNKELKKEAAEELRANRKELKILANNYSQQLDEAKKKYKQNKVNNIDKHKLTEEEKIKIRIDKGEIYEISVILKIALYIAKIFAMIESLLFIPFAWSIWFFTRFDNIYNGKNIDNLKSIGWNALVFYGIIPGIIILCSKPKLLQNTNTNTNTNIKD